MRGALAKKNKKVIFYAIVETTIYFLTGRCDRADGFSHRCFRNGESHLPGLLPNFPCEFHCPGNSRPSDKSGNCTGGAGQICRYLLLL